jgi:hypothetical protein
MRDGSSKIGSMITVAVMLVVSMAAGASLIVTDSRKEATVVSFIGTTPATATESEPLPPTF